MSTPITLIAAVAENGVIGAAGGIPWRIPSDLAHFRRLTLGKPIVMGRKQFESVGRPLPRRVNIVVSRQHGYQPDGVIVISDVGSALVQARALAAADGADEVMVIGGGEIYRETIESADRLVISHVALRPEGETMFPPIDPERWEAIGELPVEAGPDDEARYRILDYRRRGRAH